MMERLHQETASQASSDGINGNAHPYHLLILAAAALHIACKNSRTTSQPCMCMSIEGLNQPLLATVVAFTGGNGPALTAYLLNNLFDGSVVGCVGNVNCMSQQLVEHSRYVADLLGTFFPLDSIYCHFVQLVLPGLPSR